MRTITVNTPCGKVIGEEMEYGARFRAIPYAKAGRFEKPVEIECMLCYTQTEI